jgi:secretion/DNA translocation related CpaE-like protein
MQPPPLLATADPALIEHVRSFARAGAVTLDVLTDAESVRAAWHEHSRVLVGADLCPALVGLPRRSDVAVVVWSLMPGDGIPAPVWSAALALGAEHVVALPEGDLWLAEHLALSRPAPLVRGRVLAVTGACGGAGASTAAVGIAYAAQRAGRRAVLIDTDFSGGGLDLLLGAESETGARWPSLALTNGRLSEHTLLPSLPTAHGICLISADRAEWSHPAPEAWTAVLDFARSSFDIVVIDLARALQRDVAAWLAPTAESTLWCITPTRIRAIAATAVLLDRLTTAGIAAEVIVRAGDRTIAKGDVQRALGRPVHGCLPDDHGAAIAAEQGQPASGAFAKACRALVDEWLEP